MEARFDWMRRINETKGADYAGDGDVLANIRRTAEHLGVTNRLTMMVHMEKHLDAIYTYCKSPDGTLKSEGIDSRLGDVMFYCLMLEADAAERQGDRDHSTAVNATPPGRADQRMPPRAAHAKALGQEHA